MDYPKHHKQIVEDLMDGKFILSKEKHFEELKIENEFYSKFFKISFEYELIVTQEYAYIISEDTNENLSRDISIFLAILCYELDKEGKNFLDNLEYNEFSREEIERLFLNSSYIDLIETNKQLNDADSRWNLIRQMDRRSIVERVNDDKFFFTPAYKVFIDFARELGSQPSTEI